MEDTRWVALITVAVFLAVALSTGTIVYLYDRFCNDDTEEEDQDIEYYVS